MLSYKKLFFRSIILNFVYMGGLVILLMLASIILPYFRITTHNFIFLLILGITRIISDTLWYRPKIKVKSINDKLSFIVNLKEILSKLNWKIIKEENHTFEVKLNSLTAFLCGRIIINVCDNQVELIGASKLIEDLIWDIENK